MDLSKCKKAIVWDTKYCLIKNINRKTHIDKTMKRKKKIQKSIKSILNKINYVSIKNINNIKRKNISSMIIINVKYKINNFICTSFTLKKYMRYSKIYIFNHINTIKLPIPNRLMDKANILKVKFVNCKLFSIHKNIHLFLQIV